MRSTELAKTLAQRVESVVSHLLPYGKRIAHEWCVGSLSGEPGQSLRVHLVGDKAGAWCDFSDPDTKGDLFGLWKAVRGLEDKEAAFEIREWLGDVKIAPLSAQKAVERINTPAPKGSVDLTSSGAPPTHSWPYYDHDGGLLGYECRFATNDDRGKTYKPYTHAADGWAWKGFSKPLPIYNVQGLLGFPKAQVIVCEGAKAADAAQRLFPSAVAVTWPGGASRAKDVDWSILRGRDVTLWPDNDEAGAKAMMDVWAAIGEELRIIDPAGMPDKWDAADFNLAQCGRPREWIGPRLRKLAAPVTAPVVEPSKDVEPVEEFLVITEKYLAGRFCEKNPGMRYIEPWKNWMEWDGKRWQMEETRRALDLATGVCLQACAEVNNLTEKEMKNLESARMRAAVENLAREDRRAAARVDQWDTDLWALNTPSGVVDLRTGIMRAALMDDYCTKITTATPSGDCPLWKHFVRQICDFDDDLAAFLQRVIGYSLTGDTREQVLFFFYGTGANGKGTFLNTLTAILGDYALVAGMDVFTDSKHDRHPQELARLRGARMVCAQETEQGRRWAEARIKALTGGDPITARFMHKGDFTFMPQFKLIIAGNHKPGLRNVDEAMRRRLHLVPFTVTIPREQRDLQLGEKLKAEASGILQWAIDGCIEWQKQGLAPPTVVKEATNEYLNSQDIIGLWIEENTKKGSGETTGKLYKNFKGWLEERGDLPINQARFNEMLTHNNFHIRILHGLKTVVGLDLRDTSEHVEF